MRKEETSRELAKRQEQIRLDNIRNHGSNDYNDSDRRNALSEMLKGIDIVIHRD